LKASLQSLIDEQHVTLSEGRPYGLPTRTVTFQARDGGPGPAFIGWDQDAGWYAPKAPAVAHLSLDRRAMSPAASGGRTVEPVTKEDF